jgi:lipoprotein-releasing system permease protein
MRMRMEPIANPDSVASLLMQRDPDILAWSPFLVYKVGVSSKRANDGVVVYGINTQESEKVLDLYKKVKYGVYSTDSVAGSDGVMRPGLLVGSGLAHSLRVDLGDKLVLQTFQSPDEMASSGGPRMMQFVVTGVFETGMYEYDANLIYVGIPELQRLLGVRGVSGLQFKIKDPWKSEVSTQRANDALDYPFYASDWKSKNTTLLKWMNYEKFIVAAIVCLIILIAAFNIISSLIMAVTDKTREIGILRSMGLSRSSVMRVFVFMGSAIGVGGSLLGGTVGLALCLAQQHWHFIKLPPDVYMLPYFPVQVQALDVLAVLVVGNALCVLASLLPAAKAAQMDPVGAIRHE